MNVSTTRPVAAGLVPTDDRMSIALIGTSRMWSPRCSMFPTASARTITIPSVHQVNPTSADRATATRTPATTLPTRRRALRSV